MEEDQPHAVPVSHVLWFVQWILNPLTRYREDVDDNKYVLVSTIVEMPPLSTRDEVIVEARRQIAEQHTNFDALVDEMRPRFGEYNGESDYRSEGEMDQILAQEVLSRERENDDFVCTGVGYGEFTPADFQNWYVQENPPSRVQRISTSAVFITAVIEA